MLSWSLNGQAFFVPQFKWIYIYLFFSLKEVTLNKHYARGFRTYGFTVAMAKQVAVFLCTTRPSRDFPLTMQYGTPILRQSAGRKSTIWKEVLTHI